MDFFPAKDLQNSSINGWNFDSSYLQLPEDFYTRLNPVAVNEPHMVLFNRELADELGLEIESLEGELMPHVFSGNVLPKGAKPFSQAYAGHQFGHFTMLGDGRASILGEHLSPTGKRVDIQLKGSGRTPYSRGGDGRATLKSMLREYLISEAVHHLGIPGSRSLAVLFTGEGVPRERLHPGGILTRVASSHLRIGTFEYAIKFTSPDKMRRLLDYTIQRHFPQILQSQNHALALLEEVMMRQIDLVVHWTRVGFIHGVMNTDNTTLSGETIDYGPCAFMNAYDPATVFSSIDTGGRYSFGNQPAGMRWNLSVFAGALLPLINENTEKAKEMATEILEHFTRIYHEKWLSVMGQKLGFIQTHAEDEALIREFLSWMEVTKADYTNTFHSLILDKRPAEALETDELFNQWHHKWKKRILTGQDQIMAQDCMKKVNPVFIPRNHLVEEALDDAGLKGDFTRFNELSEIYKQPYQEQNVGEKFTAVPEDFDRSYQTFCGT